MSEGKLEKALASTFRCYCVAQWQQSRLEINHKINNRTVLLPETAYIQIHSYIPTRPHTDFYILRNEYTANWLTIYRLFH